MMERMSTKRSERAWVLYDVANSAYTLMVITAIFPLFYKNVIAADLPGAVSTARLAFASSAFTLVVAVLATALGPMADYEGRKKRFFAVFFGLGVAATGVLAFAPAGRELAVLAVYGLSAIGFAAANVFYDSFLTDVTTPERMDRVSAAGYAWGYIGSTVPFVAAMALIHVGPGSGLMSATTAVRVAILIAAVWWAVFTVPMFRSVRQVHFVPGAGTRAGDLVRDSVRRVAAVARDLRGHRAVFLFLAAYFFYIDGVGTVIKLATAYGTDLGLSAETLLVMLLVVQVVAFPCALIYGRLAGRSESATRTLLLIGICIYTVITVVAFVIPRLPEPARVPVFWAISLLVASSQGGIQALSRSFYAALIPADSSAEFFGFYNIFGKFAAIVGPVLVGVFAQLTGDSSIGVLSIAVLFLVGGILLMRVPAARPPGSGVHDSQTEPGY